MALVGGQYKSAPKVLNEELLAAQKLFKGQGDSPEQMDATLNLMRATGQRDIEKSKRELLSIWLPSILMIINIAVTITIKNSK